MRRRTAALTAGLATGAVATGLAGRAVLRRRRRGPDPEAREPLAELPPEDLGPIVSFDGTELAVRAAGDRSAPAVVFAHGFSLDMTTWHYQWTALRDRYRIVLFDLRGHGRSSAAAGGDLSPEASGRDLLAVLEHAVPDRRALLVGHSLGAMGALAASQGAAGTLAERLAGVVLMSTSVRGLPQGLRGLLGERAQGLLRPRLSSLSETAARLDRWRRLILERGTDVGYLLTRATQFSHDAPPSLVEYVARLAGEASQEVWTDGLAALVDVDLAEGARRLTVPALVVVGERDRVTPPATAVALARLLPDAHLEVVEGAGHMAMMERHERVTALLEGFAERVLDPRRSAGRRPAAGASRSSRGDRR